ncbi:hypothetical protein GCM10027290_17960 [Micromonospora sonneratiae]
MPGCGCPYRRLGVGQQGDVDLDRPVPPHVGYCGAYDRIRIRSQSVPRLPERLFQVVDGQVDRALGQFPDEVAAGVADTFVVIGGDSVQDRR